LLFTEDATVEHSLVVLIGGENGKRIKNTSGVDYNDEYVRRGNAMSKRFACTLSAILTTEDKRFNRSNV